MQQGTDTEIGILRRVHHVRVWSGNIKYRTLLAWPCSGPALTIAGLYAKRIAWDPIWIGIRIRTYSSFVSSNRVLPFVYTFSGIFVELLKVIQSAGMCK